MLWDVRNKQNKSILCLNLHYPFNCNDDNSVNYWLVLKTETNGSLSKLVKIPWKILWYLPDQNLLLWQCENIQLYSVIYATSVSYHFNLLNNRNTGNLKLCWTWFVRWFCESVFMSTGAFNIFPFYCNAKQKQTN